MASIYMNMKKMNFMSDSSNRFSDKWSAEVAVLGHTQLPNCLIRCRVYFDISNAELATLMYIISCKFDDRSPFPSAGKIARASGCSPMSIRDHLRSLEKKGLVKRTFRTGMSNKYDLYPLTLRLEEHIRISHYPIEKSVGRYRKTNTPPYRNLNTKEDGSKRRLKNNTKHEMRGGTKSLSGILQGKRYE